MSEEVIRLAAFAEDKTVRAILMGLVKSHLKDMEKKGLLPKNRNKTEAADEMGK